MPAKSIRAAASNPAEPQRPRTPFGIGALGKALSYPFQFPVALIGAILLYALLMLGSQIGMRSGLTAVMLANGVLFGCLTQVIKQVAWGRFRPHFLDGFDSFSLWDNAIHPTFLGFAVIAVTFGPLLILLLGLLTGWLGQPADMPGSHEYAMQEAQKQMVTGEDLKAIIDSEGGEKEKQAMEKLGKFTPAAEAQQMVDEKTPKPESSLLAAWGEAIISHQAGWVLGLMLLTLLWAAVYYPMALAVAGYSEEFGSILNPLVGLDTIRRMGFVYWKVFAMYAGVQGIGLILVVLIGVATASMSLPLMGNIPARLLGCGVTFYTSLAVAYLLGLSLNHCAKELNIPTD